MAFVFGGSQYVLPRNHLFHRSTSSSWSLQNLITCLFMQAFFKFISSDRSFLLRHTQVFSLVMQIYRPQNTDRVWRESPSLCTLFLGMFLLNVTRVPVFTCLRSSFR